MGLGAAKLIGRLIIKLYLLWGSIGGDRLLSCMFYTVVVAVFMNANRT